MAPSMSFVKWTDQGIKNAKNAPKRLDAFEAAAKPAGGRLKYVYPVTGEYDLIVIITEAPSDEVWPRSRWRRRCKAMSARSRPGPLPGRRSRGSSPACHNGDALAGWPALPEAPVGER